MLHHPTRTTQNNHPKTHQNPTKPPLEEFACAQNKKQGFYAASKKEPHTLQPNIKLWQPAQPTQTKKTNQKTTEHNPNQTLNPYILYSKQQQNHKTTNTHQPTKHTAPATTNTTTNKNKNPPIPHDTPHSQSLYHATQHLYYRKPLLKQFSNLSYAIKKRDATPIPKDAE